MKKLLVLITILMIMTAVNAQTIQLPAPQTTGGLPTNEAIAKRHSTREYTNREALDLQTVSNLLWATCGVNRPEGMRTNPTALNKQEVEAYYFDANGVYVYDFQNNALTQVASGDKRALLAGTPEFSQDFVLDAPAAVMLAVDTTKTMGGERGLQMALVDAGIANENLNIFCSANGLVTVPRATMDVPGLRSALNLPETVLPVLNNPIGKAE